MIFRQFMEALENEGLEQIETDGVEFDPNRVSYDELLDVFWTNHDPSQLNRQGPDIGTQYRSVIFFHDDEQKGLAEASKAELMENGPFREPIFTEILAAGTFYPAEEYHQDYYVKNPIRYKFYRSRCGRDDRLEELWGAKGG